MLISPKFKYPQLDICLIEEIDSTNNYAKQTSFEKDTLIIADYQSAGRGRFQRSFYSPKGKGLYFTLVIHQLSLSLNLYTLIMAIAVSYVIKNSTIKWLNDILIGHKKVCGILCETVVENGQVSKLMIGVGINLFEAEKPQALRDVMTSLNDEQLNVEKFYAKF